MWGGAPVVMISAPHSDLNLKGTSLFICSSANAPHTFVSLPEGAWKEIEKVCGPHVVSPVSPGGWPLTGSLRGSSELPCCFC